MGRFNISSIRGVKAPSKSPSVPWSSSQPSHKILYVCTGNIARSASAEVISTHKAHGSGWTFESAGIGAVVGGPVAPFIDEELSARRLNFAPHRGRQITSSMVKEADLILVMELNHLDWIVREWPQYRSKVHLLKQMARLRAQAGRRSDPISYMNLTEDRPTKADNIADPFRKGKKAAKIAVQEVEEALEIIIPWLGNVAGVNNS